MILTSRKWQIEDPFLRNGKTIVGN